MLHTTKRILSGVLLGASLCLANSSVAQTSDLLISEYIEGSSNNKYIEIFNGTSAPIDLSNYQIRLYSNGNSSPNVTNTLSGFLADSDVVVYSNSSATIYGGSSINLGTMSFNGDDAIELYNTVTGMSVDIFGVIGCDPGSQWISTTNRTQNRTLRRNTNVLSGVTTSPSCTPANGDFTTLETEWTEFPQNNIADLGNHFVLVINPPEVDLGADQTICFGATTTLYSGGDGTSFSWSTGETSSSITVSATGNYSVTVTNADGSTTDDVNVNVIPPTGLAISDPTSICSGESVEICASILTSDLIISEYLEGSGLNKCVEVYNGTGSSIDLSAEGYSIDVTFNGGSFTLSIPLSGVVANGQTHVLCDNDANAFLLNVANQTTNSSLWNGDDAVVLSKNGVAIDIFGVIGNDPGAQWSGAGNSTQNSTLRRNSSVTSGISSNPSGTGNGAFTTLGSEWTLAALNDGSDLGSHSVTGAGTFAWSTGETSSCITVTPSANTDYTFSYTSIEGCVTDISTTVSVSAGPDVDAGGCAVVYFGYAPEECTTIIATSTSAISYEWNNGIIGASQTVCPQSTTDYTVTATDASGCTAQSTITVNVVDVRCGKKNDKVLICKVPPGNSSNTQQICVSPNAVPAQLASGSYLGPCGQINPCTGIAKSNVLVDNMITEVQGFDINIYPSPLNSGDILNVAFSGIENTVKVQLFNLSGQVVGFKTIQSTGTNGQVIQLGTANLNDGIYLCKLTSETGHVSTKRFTVLR